MSSLVIALQAHVGSSRLPGSVLEHLGMMGVLEKVDDGPHPVPLTAIIASADAVVHRARAA